MKIIWRMYAYLHGMFLCVALLTFIFHKHNLCWEEGCFYLHFQSSKENHCASVSLLCQFSSLHILWRFYFFPVDFLSLFWNWFRKVRCCLTHWKQGYVQYTQIIMRISDMPSIYLQTLLKFQQELGSVEKIWNSWEFSNIKF